MPAGTYTLTASKPCYGFNPSSQEATIADADVTDKNFNARLQTYSVYGTVTEMGGGDPVAGASLSLYSLGTYLRSTVSDSSGQYMFNGLENGGYTMTLDSGCVPEGMGCMSAFVNCANVEKNFTCTGGLGESKRQEASSRRDSLMRASVIDNMGREADNGDMEATADQRKTSAISRQPSARTEASVAEYLFYHCDHLGTTRLITDKDGVAISRHDYEPFGVEIPTINDTASNTHQFTGHERDKNTGYDYMHFRYYGSNIGRFMKPDNVTGNPLNPQSWNLYSYVRGNPVNFNDPTGHQAANPEQEITQLNGNGNTQNTPSSSAAATAPTVENSTMKKKMVDLEIIVEEKTFSNLSEEGKSFAKGLVEAYANSETAKQLSADPKYQGMTVKFYDGDIPGHAGAEGNTLYNAQGKLVLEQGHPVMELSIAQIKLGVTEHSEVGARGQIMGICSQGCLVRNTAQEEGLVALAHEAAHPMSGPGHIKDGNPVPAKWEKRMQEEMQRKRYRNVIQERSYQ